MKIRKVTDEILPKALGLLKRSFPSSNYERKLIENLHNNSKEIRDWVCIHKGKVVGYIAFTNAYNGDAVCGLHLAPIAVKPELQGMGIGSELIHFALRQEEVSRNAVYVLGKPDYYKRFGFQLTQNPVCPFDKNNRHFLIRGEMPSIPFTIGYEKEFN